MKQTNCAHTEVSHEMPRGIGLTQEQKNAVFRSHRLLGKVLPTAKKHRVARSTVLAVLREFESAGFSRRPRLSLSPEVLLQLQITHLDDVIRGVKDYQPSPFSPPHEYKGSIADAAPRRSNASCSRWRFT